VIDEKLVTRLCSAFWAYSWCQPGRPFMANDSVKSLDVALSHINQDRRGFLKTLLVGSAVSAVAAIPLMTTESMAADDGCPEGQKKNKKGDCVVPKKKAE
jgi:hypothetical protein